MDLKAGEVMPWADALFKQRSEEFAKDYPGYRCMPSPGPLNSFGLFKIIQSPAVLAILPEDGTYRQIHTDDRQLPEDPNPTWVGYSVGAWDGDTLVVQSAGFNDQSWLDFFGHPHTEALRVTERYRRMDFGHMEVQMTFEDLKAYARPWTITLVAELNADTELLEYVCNENERSVQHFLVTDEDRRNNRTVVTVPREILASYVGVYQLDQPGRPAHHIHGEPSGRSADRPAAGRRQIPSRADVSNDVHGCRDSPRILQGRTGSGDALHRSHC